jgi:hypothetical protein
MMKTVLASSALFCFSMPAWAARPLVTDDARLTMAQSCQLETWVRVYPDSREAWAMAACNPGGNLELTVGGGQARNEGETATADYVFQAKTLFRPLKSNGWGWGLAVGTVRHPENNPGPNLLGNACAYLPFSASFNDDRIVIHSNVGWLPERITGNNNLSWGVATELYLSPRFSGIVEAFGDNRQRPFGQVGVRFALVPERIQTDETIGQSLSGLSTDRWLSSGLRLTPEGLF